MKKLTNAQILELLRTKESTYKYFFRLTERDYIWRLNKFAEEIDKLKDADPNAIDESHYYNQNWKSSLVIPRRKKGA